MDFTILISDRMKGVKASAVREIFKVTGQPGVISLAGGNPAPESFPVEEIKKIAAQILENEPVAALQYGVSEGFPLLRELVKKRLLEKFGIGKDTDDLIIVSGARH